MSAFKPFFVNKIIFLVIIAVVNMGGCLLEDNSGCNTGGKNCNGHFDEVNCFSSVETCTNRTFGRCGSVKFTEEPTKGCPEGNECKRTCCPICGFSKCSCSSSSNLLLNQPVSNDESVLTILNIEQTCDVITKGVIHPISYTECEILANNRVCKGFDLIQSEQNNLVDECLLYECEECQLDFPYILEDFVE